MEPAVNLKKLLIRQLILNDGTEYEGVAALTPDQDSLIVTVDDPGLFAECFTVFNDHNKTSVITSTVHNVIISGADTTDTYTDYTRLVDIGIANGNVRMILKKKVTSND